MTSSPGEAKYTHLLQPVQVGKFTLCNRVKYAACSVSNFNAPDGHITGVLKQVFGEFREPVRW